MTLRIVNWWARDPRMWIDRSASTVLRTAEDAALEHLTARAVFVGRLTVIPLLYRQTLYYDKLYMATIRNMVTIVNRDVWVGGKVGVSVDRLKWILEDIDRMMLAGDVCGVELDWFYEPVWERKSA